MGRTFTSVLTDATLLPEGQLIVLCAAGNRDQRGAWEGWAVNVFCLVFRARADCGWTFLVEDASGV